MHPPYGGWENEIALTRQDETDLLSALYEGVLEEPAWTTFRERLRRRAVAEEVYFLIARPGLGGRGHELYAHRFHSVRPLFPMSSAYRATPPTFDRLRPGRVYTGDELAEIYLTTNRRGRSALRARGRYGHLRLLRVIEAGGVNGWLAIVRAKTDFTAAEGTLLSSLASHLTIALRHFAVLRRERFLASIAAPALSRRGIGWITLDRHGHVLEHDPIAARLVPSLSGHRQGGDGHRRLSIPGGDEAIAAALDAIARGDAQSHAICASGPVPIHMLVRPADDLGSGAAAILYAQDHVLPRGPNFKQALVDLFALTSSEARLALALADGQSLAEAQASLGLARETVRSYSKSLYAKTGTHGQGGLVRLITISLAELA